MKNKYKMYMKKFSILLSLSLMLVMSALAQTTINLPDCNDCTVVSTLNCALATFDNTEFVSGEEFRATMHLPYTGGNGQPAGDLSVPSTGVTGLTADLVGMNLVLGDGSLMFYVYGIPSGPGTASFDITFGGQSCTVDLVLTETALPSASLAIGEVCSMMMDIQDWSVTAETNVTPNATSVFITSTGEIWGSGVNDGSGDLGFPARSLDAIDEDVPYISNIYKPSPVAAIYRQGLDKTWESVVNSPPITNYSGGMYAINTDNELWTWGGTFNSWDREAHGTIPAGQNYWDAWQILPPTGLAGFTQVYCHTYSIAWARGTDGKLYSWGKARAAYMGQGPHGPTAQVSVRVPTRAIQIPQSILDSEYAVIPTSDNGDGVIFIDENGDTYNFGPQLRPGSATVINDPPQLISLPAGVKATKLVGARGAGVVICLGDNGKLYFYHMNTTTNYPPASAITALNISANSQPQDTWVEFDPEGMGGTYRDVTVDATVNKSGVVVTDNGNVIQFNMERSDGNNTFDLQFSAKDIVQVWSAGNSSAPKTFYLKGSDGRTWLFAPSSVPGVDVGSGGYTNDGVSIGNVGAYIENPPNGPYLMNCYINPTGPNNATAPSPAPGDPEVTTLDCASATFNNTEFTTGEEFVASMMLPYTGGNGGSISALSINSTGVTGLTADVVAGDIASGAGTLIFYVHGTPSGAGMASFAVSFGGETCTANLTLTEAVAASTSFIIGEVCPLFLDIEDWGHNPNDVLTDANDEMLFITSQGELWGWGNNDNSRNMGYPNLLTDVPSVTAQMPLLDEMTAPSPVAAIYRQGLTKTWESVVTCGSFAGVFALATDGTLWTWGGNDPTTNHTISETAWDRPAKGGTIGTNAWTAWEIPPPAGITFTQIYTHSGQITWARGSNGRLYSWGRESKRNMAQADNGTTLEVVNTPTLAALIPDNIKDDKYAVIPSTNENGLLYIDEFGDTYFYRFLDDPAPVQWNLPAGVKAVKIAGTMGDSNPALFCLGDDDKIYYHPSTLNSYVWLFEDFIPSGTTYPPVDENDWVELDPEGAGGNYRDITGGTVFAHAVTDDGNVFVIRNNNNGDLYDMNVANLDIVEAKMGSDNVCVLKGSDGRSFLYISGNSVNSAGDWVGGPAYGTGMEVDSPSDSGGPWLINCYVNPTDPNGATGN